MVSLQICWKIRSWYIKLFNISVENQHFPNDLSVDVTPLQKKDENIDKQNYKPISVFTLYTTDVQGNV